MAKSKKSVAPTTKEINTAIGDFLFKKPEILDDGTIKTPRYETGIVMFDMLLNGGLPKGKAIAIGAEWGVGKTTLLIQALGNIAEKYNKKIYYLDAEGGATYELFEAMGYASALYDPETNPDGLFYLLNLTTIQDISKIIKIVSADPDTAAIVIDSDTKVVDGLALEEEDLGTSNKAVGMNARMWSKAAGPIDAIIKQSEACLIVVHQARVDLTGFMPKITATGGNAIKHMVSVEIWGKKKGWILPDFSISTASKDKPKAIGAYVKFTTEKNRLTKPFASVMVPIFFGKGVSNKWAYKEWLETHEFTDSLTGEVKPFINKKGSWYEITLPSGANAKVQGDTKVWDFVNDNYDEIKNYVDSHGGFSLAHEADEDDENPFDL